MSDNTNEISEGKISPRRPMVALLLSACPGLGQHYAGHLVRGIALYVALIVASWLAAIAFMFVESKVSIVFLAVPFVGVGLIALDAYLCAQRQPPGYRLQWFNRPWIYLGVFLFLLATVNPLMDQVVGKRIVRAFFETSSSMYPTILTRDIVLVNKLAFPGRGELALVRFSPDQGRANKLSRLIDDQLIKRVIAVPGDTVETRGREVFVNGARLTEPYAHHSEGVGRIATGGAADVYGPQKVPPDSYFVLGDNRNVSIDSRIFGFVRKEQIGGKVTKVFWSWNFDENRIRWERTAMSLK
jgi:signal peptidase I